jgi:hypothetical protein
MCSSSLASLNDADSKTHAAAKMLLTNENQPMVLSDRLFYQNGVLAVESL